MQKLQNGESVVSSPSILILKYDMLTPAAL